MTISFNNRLLDSMDPGSIHLGYVFQVSPSGPRSWHTFLCLSQLSLPNPPHSSLNYHNPISIFSHDICPMGERGRLRPSAGVVLRSCWNIFLCQPGWVHPWRMILLDANSERRTWNETSADKACTKGFGVLGLFWTGGRFGVLFVCLFIFLVFAGLFSAYLWNYNNCN